MANKAIDSAYLLETLKNFEGTIIETKYGKVRKLSQAEYNALDTAEKNNGVIYFIYDADNKPSGGGSGSSDPIVAANVFYNNATSGLAATNVQDALDEIVAAFEVLNSLI